MTRFFELRRNWPETYASFIIRTAPGSEISHLEVYESACDVGYLKNFQIAHFKQGQIPDAIPNNNGWLIVSPKFCRALNETNAVVKAVLTPFAEIVPAFCPEVLKSYFLVSVARVIDCLDLTSPDLTWFDETQDLVEKFDSLHFCALQIPPGVSFFGLKRAPFLHIVSGDIRENILRSNLTGVSFKECLLK